MSTKVIIFNSCAGCPYKYYNKNKQRTCRHSDGRVIDVAVTTIPTWCELEDYAKAKKEIEQETEKAEI